MKAFIQLHDVDNGQYATKESISQVLSITGGVASELKRFLVDIPKNVTKSNRFVEYKTQFYKSYSVNDVKAWYRNQDIGIQKIALENIERLEIQTMFTILFIKALE